MEKEKVLANLPVKVLFTMEKLMMCLMERELGLNGANSGMLVNGKTGLFQEMELWFSAMVLQ